MNILPDMTGQKFGRLTLVQNLGTINCRVNYLCLCECGAQRTVSITKLKNGHTRSCGCIKKRKLRFPQKARHALPPGTSMRNRIVSNYKSNARHKGLTWELSDDQVNVIFSGDCYYCGMPPSSLAEHKNHNGSFLYNGIDRKDNSEGYTVANSVSCCPSCNYRKSDTHHDIFVSWIKKVYNNLFVN